MPQPSRAEGYVYERHRPEETPLYGIVETYYPQFLARLEAERGPIHFHMLFLDGVYSFDRARPRFHRAPRPTPAELVRLLHTISTRVPRLLERQGLLVRDAESDYLNFEPGEALDQLIGASIRYRIAIGPNAGRKALTLRTVPAQPEPFASTLLAKQPGFSLHAATCCEAKQRDKLEKLCRYITRPAIANERLSINERGQVSYRFKKPFRDGTTHVVLDPLDFIARLAALVPRPRLNLTRFHGVFAPNCRHREHIVPRHERKAQPHNKSLAPMTWMQRLKRVFAINIETCPKCGGKLRVIACIEDPDIIATILEHIRAREETQPSQPRAPPLRIRRSDTSNQDRLF